MGPPVHCAQYRFEPFYEPAADAVLLRRFSRAAAGDPRSTHDMIEFARIGGYLDQLRTEADGTSPVRPDAWLLVYRHTAEMITGRVWPAVAAVANAPKYSPRRLNYREVSAIARAAVEEEAA